MKSINVYFRLMCLVLAALVVIIAGCEVHSTHRKTKESDPMKRSVLYVGVTANYPPLVFKRNGTLQGIEVDMANDLGKVLKKRIVFREMPFGDLIPALQKGDIDIIMSGVSVTDARKRAVQFTQNYMRVGQMGIIRKDDVMQYGSPSSLYTKRMRVGFEADTTGEQFVRENLKYAELVPLNSVKQGLDAVRKKEIDVFIHDAPTAWRIAENKIDDTLMALYWPLTEEHLAWAVNQEHEMFIVELDRVLTEWKRNGHLQNVLNRWIRVKIEVNRPG